MRNDRFIIYCHSPFLHLMTCIEVIKVYVKMKGIFRLFTTLQRPIFASKSFFARHFLSGRFQHFFIVAYHLLRPKQMKKCGMTFYIYLSNSKIQMQLPVQPNFESLPIVPNCRGRANDSLLLPRCGQELYPFHPPSRLSCEPP